MNTANQIELAPMPKMPGAIKDREGLVHTGDGRLALSYKGTSMPLVVLQSGAGFYIGTYCEDGPFSRESIEYWRKREPAEQALANGEWTLRSHY